MNPILIGASREGASELASHGFAGIPRVCGREGAARPSEVSVEVSIGLSVAISTSPFTSSHQSTTALKQHTFGQLHIPDL